MDSLTYIVDCVYIHLNMSSKNQEVSDAQDLISDIKVDCDCFFLYTALDAVDVDLFILYYLKYMNKHYPELESDRYISKFTSLKQNIIKAATVLDGAAMQFLNNNDDNNNNFIKGFLFNDAN